MPGHKAQTLAQSSGNTVILVQSSLDLFLEHLERLKVRTPLQKSLQRQIYKGFGAVLRFRGPGAFYGPFRGSPRGLGFRAKIRVLRMF